MADHHRRAAIEHLQVLRAAYQRSDLPERKARIRAIDAKIDAFEAVLLNPDAVPWVEDE